MTDANRTRLIFDHDRAVELIRTLPEPVRTVLLQQLAIEKRDKWTPQDAKDLFQVGADLAWRLEINEQRRIQCDLLIDEIALQGRQRERYACALEQATGFTMWHTFCCKDDPEPDVDHLYDTHGRRWERTYVDELDSDGGTFGLTRWIPQRFVLGKWRANPFAPRLEPWHRVVGHAPLFDTPKGERGSCT